MMKLGWFLSSFAGAAAAVFLLMMIVRAPLCLPSEGALPCAREWIGAASGYVAAAGALLAAFMTLPSLKQQANEARKQTAFAIGNATPSLDLFESLDPMQVSSFDLRIVNFNRSAFDVISIEISVEDERADKFAASLDNMQVSDGRLNQRDLKRTEQPYRVFAFARPIYLHGWEDRAVRPEFLQCEVLFGVEIQGWRPAERNVTVIVKGKLSRDGGIPITLRSSGRFVLS